MNLITSRREERRCIGLAIAWPSNNKIRSTRRSRPSSLFLFLFRFSLKYVWYLKAETIYFRFRKIIKSWEIRTRKFVQSKEVRRGIARNNVTYRCKHLSFEFVYKSCRIFPWRVINEFHPKMKMKEYEALKEDRSYYGVALTIDNIHVPGIQYASWAALLLGF